MQIKKNHKPYHKRIKEELLPRLLLWFIGFGFLIYLFRATLRSTEIESWIFTSLIALSFFYLIWESIKSAAYEITEVKLTKEAFKIRYFEESVEKEISSGTNEKITIILNRQSRGIFPLNDKNRIDSIVIKNEKGVTLIRQVSNRRWRSAELHELFYDGLEKHYNWYWRGKEKIVFVKNN